MQDSSQGIKVGDGVIEFVANMTNLDQGLDSIPGKVSAAAGQAKGSLQGLEQGFDSVGDAGSEAGDTIGQGMTTAKVNVREARGEVALLGEEFGVRLPRHVQTFVAEMPGVGEALESAFAATAVVFLAEAVVKLTEKVTEFISSTFVYTQAMKDMDKATADFNATVLAHEANIAKLNDAYDSLTMTPLQLLTKQLDQVNEAMSKQQADFRMASDQLYGYRNGTIELTAAQKVMYENIVNGNGKAMEELADKNRNLTTQIDHLYTDAANKADELSKKNMATFNQLMFQQKMYAGQLVLEYDNMVKAIMQLPTASSSAVKDMIPSLIQVRDAISSGQQAAHDMGVTLKTDLIQEMETAKTKLDAFAASGIKDEVAMKQLTKDYNEAALAVKNYGNETKTATGLVQLGQIAAKDFSSDVASGFIAAAAGQETFSIAMEKAMGKALSSLGQWCQVKAMECLAAAFAGDPSQYAAAAEYEAAAVACGIAGAVISGAAGGGSGNGSGSASGPQHSAFQTTSPTSQTPTNVQNVRSFAAGGLISAPTLAQVGDSGPSGEAVLPLDNEEAMTRIATKIVEAGAIGGNQTHHHYNIRGVISADTLAKVTKQISRGVRRGTTILTASNTHRITKRSP